MIVNKFPTFPHLKKHYFQSQRRKAQVCLSPNINFSETVKGLINSPKEARIKLYNFFKKLFLEDLSLKPGDTITFRLPVKFLTQNSYKLEKGKSLSHSHIATIEVRDDSVIIKIKDDHSKLPESLQLIDPGKSIYCEFETEGNLPETLKITEGLLSNFHIILETLYGCFNQSEIKVTFPSGTIKLIKSRILLKNSNGEGLSITSDDPKIQNSIQRFNLQTNNQTTPIKAKVRRVNKQS